MPFVLVWVTVNDYPSWRRVMAEHVTKRKELGSKGTRVFRDAERPDQVLCLTEWTDFERAREFMRWGDPKEIARRSTKKGEPEITLLNEVDRLPA